MSSPELGRAPGQGASEPIHVNPLPDGIKIGETVIPRDALIGRFREMAQDVAKFYEGQDLVLLGVLKGAGSAMTHFSEALFEAGHTTHEKTYMWMSSYHENEKKGIQVIQAPRPEDVAGKKVLIIEDVRQTDESLTLAKKLVEDAGAESVEILIVVDKPDDRKETATNPRWIGFIVHNDKDGDVWIEGLDLDSFQGGRGNPGIIKGPHHYTPQQRARG